MINHLHAPESLPGLVTGKKLDTLPPVFRPEAVCFHQVRLIVENEFAAVLVGGPVLADPSVGIHAQPVHGKAVLVIDPQLVFL